MVDRLHEAYPHQQINDATAKIWFAALEDFAREEIARALVRCLQEREFISCYALVEAVKDERRERSAVRSTVLPMPDQRTPPGPEWTEIRKVLERSKLLPGHPDHIPGPEARKRIEELHRYRVARLAEQSTAPRREVNALTT